MKMYVYINQSFVEDFLAGNLSFALSLSSDSPEEMARYSTAIPAGTVDIELDINEVDVRQSAITNLEIEADKIRAEMSAKLQRVETKKQQLLALEHKGDSNE